jgi:maleate isomerase
METNADATRIGVVYVEDGATPASTRVAELTKFLPLGVQVRLAPQPAPDEENTVEHAERLALSEDIESAAMQLLSYRPKVISYDCMTVSFVMGSKKDEIAKRIEAVTGIPAVTTSMAVLRALTKLRVQRVAIASPYLADVEERLVQFLGSNGFFVVGGRSLALERNHSCVTSNQIRETARAADVPSADVILIGCAGQKTAEFIADLEQELGKPVVTANQATMWAAMRLAGVSTLRNDVGALMAQPW